MYTSAKPVTFTKLNLQIKYLMAVSHTASRFAFTIVSEIQVQISLFLILIPDSPTGTMEDNFKILRNNKTV